MSDLRHPLAEQALFVIQALLDSGLSLAQQEDDAYVVQARRVDNGYIITIAEKVKDEPTGTLGIVPQDG